MLRKLRPLLPDWLLGALCLLIPALYNGFPLLTPDSSAYIGNAFSLYVPVDRPVTYSLFLRITTMGVSLWGVVAAQALILSGLLLLLAQRLLAGVYRRAAFAGLMLLLGTVTSAGWFAGQIMPDVFTAVLLLSLLLLCVPPLSNWLRWTLYVLMLLCVTVHNSNLLIALLTGVMLLVQGWRKRDAARRRVAVALLGISVAGWLGLSAMNYKAGHGFRPSAASHVFLMSRMIESGLMDDFLNDYCVADTMPYKLCAYRRNLPDRQWAFMWDAESPLYRAGGWEATEPEYTRIIGKTLTTPKYMVLHGVKAAQATLRQMPLLYVGDGFFRFKNDSILQGSMRTHFPGEQKELNVSAQQEGGLHLDWWNPILIAVSLLLIIAALLLRPLSLPQRLAGEGPAFAPLVRLALLFLFFNAAVTAALATVVGRYEARVFWVLPFLAILYMLRRNHYRTEGAR